jgi:hypothetical protein
MAQGNPVVGLYALSGTAEEVVPKLGQGGFPIQHVSIFERKCLRAILRTHTITTGCPCFASAIQSLAP